MTTQAIFNTFGLNWKWASRTAGGIARLHTIRPTITTDGVLAYNRNKLNFARCEAFDHREMPQDAACVIWERTYFANGPDYTTDAFGCALYKDEADVPLVADARPARRGDCAENGCENERGVFGQYCHVHSVPPMPVAPPPPPAPALTRLTTDEAENGMLWGFARSYECFATVHVDGTVYFSDMGFLEENGIPQRAAVDVVVDGVVAPIYRYRAQPYAERVVPAPAMPVLDFAYPAPGLREDGLEPPDDAHGWADGVAELEQKLKRARTKLRNAKENAQHLLKQYNADGSQQLTAVQYMAIFGKQPE